MSANKISIGTLVRAERDGKTVEARVYNLRSVFNDRTKIYKDTYWLQGTLGSFDKVTPV